MTRTELLQLFELYGQDLRRFLTSRVACEATAADLTQETYLRLSQLPQSSEIGNLRTYLFRIAANLATDHIRAQRRRVTLPDDCADLQNLADRGPSPETAMLAKEELDLVQQALAELSPLCRQIVALNRIEGLPHSEIAARLGICKSTVEKNLARALNHCRRRLNQS